MGTLLTWEQNTGKFPFHSGYRYNYRYRYKENREPFKVLTMTINENAATITESLFIFASLA